MPDKNAEILLNAVERNTAIVLSLPSAGMLRNHKSRLLCQMEGGILIAAPHGDEDRLLAGAQDRSLGR